MLNRSCTGLSALLIKKQTQAILLVRNYCTMRNRVLTCAYKKKKVGVIVELWDDSESVFKRYLRKTEKLQCFGLLSKTKTHLLAHSHTRTHCEMHNSQCIQCRCRRLWMRLWLRLRRLCICAYAGTHAAALTKT